MPTINVKQLIINVKELLGSGSFADVVKGRVVSAPKAQKALIGVDVAVKIINRASTTATVGDATGQFVKEVEAQTLAASEGVAPCVYAADVKKGALVMELLRAPDYHSLASLTRSASGKKELPEWQQASILRALAKLHRLGIRYADTNVGQNVFIPSKPTQLAKIIDYGILEPGNKNAVFDTMWSAMFDRGTLNQQLLLAVVGKHPEWFGLDTPEFKEDWTDFIGPREASTLAALTPSFETTVERIVLEELLSDKRLHCAEEVKDVKHVAGLKRPRRTSASSTVGKTCKKRSVAPE